MTKPCNDIYIFVEVCENENSAQDRHVDVRSFSEESEAYALVLHRFSEVSGLSVEEIHAKYDFELDEVDEDGAYVFPPEEGHLNMDYSRYPTGDGRVYNWYIESVSASPGQYVLVSDSSYNGFDDIQIFSSRDEVISFIVARVDEFLDGKALEHEEDVFDALRSCILADKDAVHLEFPFAKNSYGHAMKTSFDISSHHVESTDTIKKNGHVYADNFVIVEV